MKTLSGIYEGYNYSIDEFANIKDLETGLDVPCYIDSKTKFHIVRLHKNKK